MRISGLECIVTAQIVNGNLKGSVTCSISSKNFKFDFLPALKQRYQNTDIGKELKRLSFDVSLNERGKEELVLKIQEGSSYGQNFIVSLRGALNRRISMTLEVDYDKLEIYATCKISQKQNTRKVDMFVPRVFMITREF